MYGVENNSGKNTFHCWRQVKIREPNRDASHSHLYRGSISPRLASTQLSTKPSARREANRKTQTPPPITADAPKVLRNPSDIGRATPDLAEKSSKSGLTEKKQQLVAFG